MLLGNYLLYRLQNKVRPANTRAQILNTYNKHAETILVYVKQYTKGKSAHSKLVHNVLLKREIRKTNMKVMHFNN